MRSITTLDLQYAHRFFGFKGEAQYLHGHTGILTIEVEDYSTNEKIFYPPGKLDASDAPVADAGKGTLAYYAPWGDVVMFYDYFGKGSSLYELGTVISGEEFIEALSGSVLITGENETAQE